MGRTEEMADLSRAMDQTAAGRGRLVLVSGEAGIGKTRLCEELATKAVEAGSRVAWSASWEGGDMPPLWPWRQLLDQLGNPTMVHAYAEGAPEVARAQQLASLVDALSSATVSGHQLMVLDDLQWADADSVVLLARLEPLLRTMRVLVVATVRSTLSGRSVLTPRIFHNAQAIHLHGLSDVELAHLVEGITNSGASDAVAKGLFNATGGNPLFAAELVRRLHRDGRLQALTGSDDLPLSPTVRAVLDEQLGECSDRCRSLLATASLIGPVFALDLAAEVGDLDAVEALVLIDEASAGGVVNAGGPGQYGFTHPLLRSVLHDEQGIARRVQLHERIGDALEARAARGEVVDLAALAHHYLHAAPGATTGKAVTYATRAAQDAMGALAYEAAAELYDRALSALTVAPTAGDRHTLLLGLGRARAACGSNERARAVFLDAAEAARVAGRPEQLAAAALALAGTGFELALFDEDHVALLEEALAGLGDDQHSLRARLSARLSVALSLSGQDARRAELSRSAVGLANDARDEDALAQALAARCDAHAGPEHAEQRLNDANEIVRIASAHGDRGTELLGRRLRLVALLEQGRVLDFDAEVLAFANIADWLQQAQYQCYVPLWRGLRAAIDGRIRDQQTLSSQAEALGRVARSANTEVLVLGQRYFSLVESGESEEAVRVLDDYSSPRGYGEMGPQMVPYFALNRVLMGRPEEAGALLDAAAEDFRAMPRDSEWLPMLAVAAEVCHRIGGHALVPWLYDTLSPFADRWSVEGIACYTHGPLHRQLALLAAMSGETDTATRHFEAALTSARRVGARLLVSRLQYDWGIVLADLTALTRARDDYQALGVESFRIEIDGLIGLKGNRAMVPPDGIRSERNELTPNGDTWAITFNGHRANIRDAKGVRDLARLLAEPGREIAALELATPGGSSLPRTDLGEVVDARARAAYKRRLFDLEADLDDADSAGDQERSAKAQAERDALLQQLSGAYGLGGKPRRAGDPAERARTAVTARLRDAIRRIEKVHPSLGRHLQRSVRTGTFCVYDPDPPIDWRL